MWNYGRYSGLIGEDDGIFKDFLFVSWDWVVLKID